MTKLTIDRTKWIRGEGANKSKLLREEDGKMCCLGFYSLQCGLSEAQILDVKSPTGTAREDDYSPSAQWLFSLSEILPSDDAFRLMKINDGSGNEEEIAGIFAKHDVEVEFIN